MIDPGIPRKAVFITGASSGIGYAAALAFATRGDTVGALARRLDRLHALQDAGQALPGRIVPLEGDVRERLSVQQAVAGFARDAGRLDILVANAGLGQRGPLVDAPWDEIETVLRTNIDGVLHTVRATVPEMRKNGGGHIVMVSSVVSYITTPFSTTYAASKAAVNAFGRGLRTELRSDNIWVTNLLVGQTETDFSKNRLGKPGRIVGVPGMTAEQVAAGIVRATRLHRRQYTLRLFDKALMAAGQYLPWLMDRIVARSYQR